MTVLHIDTKTGKPISREEAFKNEEEIKSLTEEGPVIKGNK